MHLTRSNVTCAERTSPPALDFMPMGRPQHAHPRSHHAMWFASLGSLSVHAALAALSYGAGTPVERAFSPSLELPFSIEVTAPPGPSDAARQGAPPTLHAGGADPLDNVDGRHRREAGDARGSADVIMLVPRVSEVTLSDAPMNVSSRAQTQRIATARDRASAEDRRATPHPSMERFLASGAGPHPERRPLARNDARTGARTAPAASARGSASPRGSRAETGSTPIRQAGAVERSGGADASPGRGILDGRGVRAQEAAAVSTGRPTLDEAHAATTTELRDAHVRDDVDSELRAARPMQSEVEASTARSVVEAEGRGGTVGEGRPSAGVGSQTGGQARALGPGTGSWDVLDPSDPSYRRWFVELRRRIEDALVFPRARQLAMDQGTAVYALLVRRDGSLARRPRLLRSSGFADLDEAARLAVEQSAPFGPVPSDLVPARDAVEVRIPIEFSNPMFH